ARADLRRDGPDDDAAGHHHELPREPGLRSDRRRHLCGAGGAGARAALAPRSHLRHRTDHFVGRSMSTSAGGSKMADVELRGIAKRYGAVQAVAALDLRVEPGQFVSLLAPSGCGQATTLRLVRGLVPPAAG